ncbi:RnfABCDGE type electron transport complex subunit G [Chlamydiota bacterium]
MKEFSKLILSLTMTCAIAALALSFVFLVTKEPIAQQRINDKLVAIKSVLPPYTNDPVADKIILKDDDENFEYYIGKTNGLITGIALESSGKGYAGDIRIMVGFTLLGTISGLEILDNKETPGLGTRVSEELFKKQFVNKKAETSKLISGGFAVKKDGGDIDAVTGATISSRGVVDAVNKALHLFLKHKNRIQ